MAGGFALAGSLLLQHGAFATPDVSALWSLSLEPRAPVLRRADSEVVRVLIEPLALARNMALILLAASGVILAAPRLVAMIRRNEGPTKGREARKLETARQQIDGELLNILNLFRSQIDQNQSFSAALDSGQAKLATPQSQEQVSAVIQLLLAENQQMLSNNAAYERKLHESRAQIASLRVTLSETLELSLRDSLTNLFTRRHFDSTLSREIRKADKSSAPLSLILADIDHFKRINDNFGHPIGDEVLKKFAEILQAGAGESGSVARYGGEEFAIILPATSAPAAGKLADEIRERLESTKWLMRGVTPLGVITASFGVAQHHAEESPDSLIQRADAKLYLSKATGRNRVSR